MDLCRRDARTTFPYPGIEFLSTIDVPTPGLRTLSKIFNPVAEREHQYRGFNLFDDDQKLFEVLCRGEFFIQGFRTAVSASSRTRQALLAPLPSSARNVRSSSIDHSAD
jgi:hypothetical protein